MHGWPKTIAPKVCKCIAILIWNIIPWALQGFIIWLHDEELEEVPERLLQSLNFASFDTL